MQHTGNVPDMAEIANRLAIEDVLAVHCRGVDRADEVALKSAYWDDAEVCYGGFEGLAHRFCEMLPGSIVRFSHTQHSISNVVMRFSHDAQEAAVETYVTAYHYLAAETASASATGTSTSDTEMTFIGRYLDRFQRRNECWKIAHRRVLMDWNQHADASAVWEGPPFEGLARGARYPEDPVYPLFNWSE